MAAFPPAVGALGLSLGGPVPFSCLDVPAGGVAFGGAAVAAVAGEQVGAVSAELGDLALDLAEFGRGVGRDGGGDGLPFGLKAGVAEGGTMGSRAILVLLSDQM